MVSNLVLVLLFILPCYLAEFPLVPDAYVIEPRASTDSYRLPGDTIPISYDITLEPSFETFEFIGDVKISIEVVTTTSIITLHGKNLVIEDDDVTVTDTNDLTQLHVTSVNDGNDRDFIEITLEEEVESGSFLEVAIHYTGSLNQDNEGFYKASYMEGGEEKWFATTQFEATSARLAFPCYDEPALKATFEIHIRRPEQYHSISNMPLVDSPDVGNGIFQDNYEVSVEMSTYLVAFVVSELGVKENEELTHAVYAVPDLIDRATYALDKSIATLQEIIDFTGVDYSLEKMYQVAIPDDYFSAGAMENWGLVTYKERYLLYEDGVTTASEKQNIASIIAHEYGHQWFGNLVSPSWWNYIWLNEGFATYFEYYASSKTEVDMRMMDQMVVRTHQYAMESDALRTTRPMTADEDIETPEAISALFDRIAYDKSGSVIRMMEHFLTTEIFQRGLESYLNTNQYQAAVADDLWTGLQAGVDQINPDILGELTVKEIMDTWHLTAGFPVVNVVRNNEGVIVLSQLRFLLNEYPTTDTSRWTIPINYVTSKSLDFSDTTATYWLQEAREVTDITIEENEFIILNKQETGFYRVNYEVANWNLIIQYLQSNDFENIHVLNRAQLVDDALNLARSNRLSYNVTMDLLKYLSKEEDYIPLYSFFSGLTFLNNQLLNTEIYDRFKIFVKDTLQTAYTKLSVTDSDVHIDKLNRINVLTWLCRFEHEDCLNTMHTALTAGDDVAPDLQAAVFCGGLATNSDTDSKWAFLYGRYTGDDAYYLEKNRIASALGCTPSVVYLTRLLDSIVNTATDYTIDDSDKISAISGIYSNSKLGLETTFNYILDNFSKFTTSFTTNQLSSIFSGLSDKLTTREQKTKLEEFIHGLTEETRTEYFKIFDAALNKIETNIQWADNNIEEITVWLEINTSSSFAFTLSIPLLILALCLHIFK